MRLTDSIKTLPGVGPKRLAALTNLGLDTIESLLMYYPIRYEDLRVKPFNFNDKKQITLRGIVVDQPTLTHYGNHKSRLIFRLLVDQNNIYVIFFNQPWIQTSISIGRTVLIYGRFDATRRTLTGMKIITANNDDIMNPIYPANVNIRQTTIRQLVIVAWEQYKNMIQPIIPDVIIAKYRLMDRRKMIHDMHFPVDSQTINQARRSAKFEEFFLFQMRIQGLKHRDQSQQGIAIEYNNNQLKQFVRSLPYNLTSAQKRVVNEICLDLKSPVHMNRLLQGDVGSGKTIVAALVMYATITGNFQAVLMAPTEILAEQHANNLKSIFECFPVKIALLTGSTKDKCRRAILSQIENGKINLIVGTHSLIQKTVKYHQLGLIVIDEQHRFGVGQRQALREKGVRADVLTMSATPIPRTLAITSYGDMDISVIDELPNGRKSITTWWIKDTELVDSVVNLVKGQLAAGHQTYVVAPLIEKSELINKRNVQAIYNHFCTLFSPKYQVGLIHGRMSNEDREDVMMDFKTKSVQILVSTTVIEVGVDVKNATVMIIYDADHFGLAQLHQLRGRVGRSNQQAYCFLIANPTTKYGVKRMEIMTQIDNGFDLSQKDLELRGTGDVFGKKQSGLPHFKIGDPIADIDMLFVAQKEAKKLTAEDDWQSKKNNQGFVRYLNLKPNRDYIFD